MRLLDLHRPKFPDTVYPHDGCQWHVLPIDRQGSFTRPNGCQGRVGTAVTNGSFSE